MGLLQRCWRLEVGRRSWLLWVAVGCLLASESPGAWPTFRRSPTRNAVCEESGFERRPRLVWRHQPAFGPQTAWHGPAKWDAYANLSGLHSMRGYDQAFYVIAADVSESDDGGDPSLFYASSAEHCVRRLDAATGEVLWTYFVDAPVRITPTLDGNRLYFAADDGCVYCLAARSGELVWKFTARSDGRQIVNNGNLIPEWPIRTGVTVLDGIAYFAASLLPWNQSYFYAVDAATGQQIYCVEQADATFEGPLVASPKHLIAPQGRVAPLLLDRDNGQLLGQLSGGGGSFCVLVDESTMIHGPGNKAGWMTVSSTESREKIATHESARRVVHVDDVTYFCTAKDIVAYDTSQEQLWSTTLGETLDLIAADGVLLAAGVGQIAALEPENGDLLWSLPVNGRVKGLAIDQGRLFASLDDGTIIAYQRAGNGQATTANVEPIEVNEEFSDSPNTKFAKSAADVSGHRVAVGPWLRFAADGTAEVNWISSQPCASKLVFRSGGHTREIEDAQATTEHRVVIGDLQPRHIYHYKIVEQVDGRSVSTAWYECDTFFNYHRDRSSIVGGAGASGGTDTRYDSLAGELAGLFENSKGLCLVLGASDGARFAEALARATEMRIHVLDPDAQRVEAARRRLVEAGVYGVMVSVRAMSSEQIQSVTDRIATVVTSGAMIGGRDCPYDRNEMDRLVSPNGLVAISNRSTEKQDGQDLTWQIRQGKRLQGSGDWSHVYGRPDNAAYAGEELDHCTSADDLAVQWIGRPGPRYQSDRSGRKTPPLSVAGRLFLQGLDRIVCVDAYNGSVLWSLETPYFSRFNLPRDCGNWCADERFVYALIRDHCWKIDAVTGDVRTTWRIPDEGLPAVDGGYAWGYVGRSDDALVGSVNRADANWTDYFGGPGWYDATTGEETRKIVSDRLFVIDADTGKQRWATDRLILNTTITIDDGLVYFAEVAGDQIGGGDARRLEGEPFWDAVRLVALDLKDGRQVWTRPIQGRRGDVAFWMAVSQGRLITVASADVKFDVRAYDSRTGEPIWDNEAAWGKGKADHGTHLSRPAIVNDQVIVRPAVFSLSSGQRSPDDMPVSGCGTYACSSDAMFFRAWSGQQFAMWSPKTNEYTRWSRLRPDCWLSTIPASGLLLSPEGGGGCSCGNWLETSLAFIPKSQLSQFPDAGPKDAVADPAASTGTGAGQ